MLGFISIVNGNHKVQFYYPIIELRVIDKAFRFQLRFDTNVVIRYWSPVSYEFGIELLGFGVGYGRSADGWK